MYVVVGLGNPGNEYQTTRHNAGFLFIDSLAEEYKIPLTQKKFKAFVGRGNIPISNEVAARREERRVHSGTQATQQRSSSFIADGSADVLLVKPQTFMNLSGDSVQQILNYFKVPETHLIVVFDDLDLPHGQVKTRFGGGHGGHNGIRHILECIPSDKFYRVKIGIGKPTHKNATSNWVLNPFDQNELETLNKEVFPTAKERLFNIIREIKK